MSAVLVTASTVAFGTAESAPENCTEMIAARPFAEVARVAYWLNGLVLLSTPSTSAMVLTMRPIAAFSAGAATLCPGGATTIACALPPAACGNTASSRSRAACDSVPGIVKLSASLPPKPNPATQKATSSSTQAATTRQGWWCAMRPRRYRNAVMSGAGLEGCRMRRRRRADRWSAGGGGREHELGEHVDEQGAHGVVRQVVARRPPVGGDEHEGGPGERDAEPDGVPVAGDGGLEAGCQGGHEVIRLGDHRDRGERTAVVH